MPSDYKAIAEENITGYGTKIENYGPVLLAHLYSDRTHFVYELLQNAEDAFRQRLREQPHSNVPHTVKFKLHKNSLEVRHFGIPFNERHVRAICGLVEGTKRDDLTAIGKFGIGFKSVYAYTLHPEIHSDNEHFVIDLFVRPREIPKRPIEPDETLFYLPFDHSGRTPEQSFNEIGERLNKLGHKTLLFLNYIESIEWTIQDTASGICKRSVKNLDDQTRKVTLSTRFNGNEPQIEEWLVFRRPIFTRNPNEEFVGSVEIAYQLIADEKSGEKLIHPISDSKLFAFFATEMELHLGFLVQGPYRTTPSRDNIPKDDEWNKRLVQETAILLRESLTKLREMGLLSVQCLEAMPLDRAKFSEGSMFRPLFDATKHALSSEPLLPRFDTGHVSARMAKMARTQELRELISPKQLASLFGIETELAWLSSDITQDRTPELRLYLMRELNIAEFTPEMILPTLNREFLEAQPDDWILKLYGVLNGQPALLRQRRSQAIPLVRLENGTHITAFVNGKPQVFLPGANETDFPMVRRAICATEEAYKFLRSLGLTEPDPVDDIIHNVLPKYHADVFNVSDDDYEADINRILKAFATDSKVQREKLINVLSEIRFIRAVDAGDGSKWVSVPTGVYLASERLKMLFDDVKGVFLVDDSYACLRGEDVRELLEACGAVRYLRPVKDSTLSTEERQRLREEAGHPDTTWRNDQIVDWTLVGLESLLGKLPYFSTEQRVLKSKLLWEELAHLEERRGKSVFTAEYTWTHNGSYRKSFDAAFVRRLNKVAWVPDGNGELHQPEFLFFGTLGWKTNPFLQSKIRFKPPVIEQLAKAVGIEPGVLDLLKKLGVTSEDELRKRLGVEETTSDHGNSQNNVEPAVKNILGEDHNGPTPPVPDLLGHDLPESGKGGRDVSRKGTRTVSPDLEGLGRATKDGDKTNERHTEPSGAGGKRTPGSTGGRPFISYVATHPDEKEPDLDGLDQTARMELEAKAIKRILTVEQHLQKTSSHNPGFDLFEPGTDGQPKRWIEVKAMSGDLHDRPVGLSRTQFECAREHGDSYWLYIVEHASSDTARIVRIQDPAGKARTFTFDHGWLCIAEVDMQQAELVE